MKHEIREARNRCFCAAVRTNTALGPEAMVNVIIGDLILKRRGSLGQLGFREMMVKRGRRQMVFDRGNVRSKTANTQKFIYIERAKSRSSAGIGGGQEGPENQPVLLNQTNQDVVPVLLHLPTPESSYPLPLTNTQYLHHLPTIHQKSTIFPPSHNSLLPTSSSSYISLLLILPSFYFFHPYSLL